MIITFCGHAQFRTTEQCERELLTFPETHVGDSPAQMYLGGYGEFDSFALRCCRKYRETHPQIKLVLVSPYLSDSYQRNHLCDSESRYDEILYPAIEDKPLRFAIVYRNQYMVQQADWVVTYVTHGWGGAYRTYRYALQKAKQILCTRKEQAALPFPDFKKPTEHTDSAGFFRDRKFTSPIPPRR